MLKNILFIAIMIATSCTFTKASNAQENIAGWTLLQNGNEYTYTRPDLKDVTIFVKRSNGAEPKILFENLVKSTASKYNCPSLTVIPHDQKGKNEKHWQLLAKSPEKTPKCHLTGGSFAPNSILSSLVVNARKDEKLIHAKRAQESIEIVTKATLMNEAISQFAKKSGEGLPKKTAKTYAIGIPKSGKPVKILEYYTGKFAFIGNYKYMLLFANGQAKFCSDWDPGFMHNKSLLFYDFVPICSSLEWRYKGGKEGKEIELKRHPNWTSSAKYHDYERTKTDIHPFKKGETFDLTIVANKAIAAKVKSGQLPPSALKKWEAIFTKDGQFFIGHLDSATIPKPKETSQGYTNPASGEYYFNGHVMTLILDRGYRKGHIVHGFVGWAGHRKNPEKRGRVLMNTQVFETSSTQ